MVYGEKIVRPKSESTNTKVPAVRRNVPIFVVETKTKKRVDESPRDTFGTRVVVRTETDRNTHIIRRLAARTETKARVASHRGVRRREKAREKHEGGTYDFYDRWRDPSRVATTIDGRGRRGRQRRRLTRRRRPTTAIISL